MSLFGTILGAGLSFLGAKHQNDRAEAAAEKQMAFQREVMQNRYQWQVADLKQAGLNPVLATGLSAGMASGSSYTPTNELNGVADAVSSAFDRRLALREQRNRDKIADAQAAVYRAQAADYESKTSADYWRRTGLSIDSQIDARVASAAESRSRTDILKAELQEKPYKLAILNQNLIQEMKRVRLLEAQIGYTQSQEDRSRMETRLARSKDNVEGFRAMILESEAEIAAIEAEAQRAGLPVKKLEAAGKTAPVNAWLRRYGAYDLLDLGKFLGK